MRGMHVLVEREETFIGRFWRSGALLLPRQSAGYIEVPMSLGYIFQ